MAPLFALVDPNDPAAGFWVNVIGLVVGLLTPAAVGVVAWVRSHGRVAKHLTYQVVSDVGLINNVKDLGPDIKLSLNGHPLDNARLIMVRLANAGAETVSEADLHQRLPLRVEFDPPSLILCAIHTTEPDGLIPQERFKDLIRLGGVEGGGDAAKPHPFADLPGLLLNAGESIELKFLTRGRSAMKVVGHLVGGRITKYVPPRPRPWRNAAMVIGGVLVGALLAYEVGFFGGFFRNCAVGPVPLNVNGSSAFYPTAVAEAESYHGSCPVAFISVGSSSSGAGLHMLTHGSIQVANSELSAQEAGYGNAGLVQHKVAVIVFGMMVNPSVTGVQSLTRAQITGIYSGSITNWDQIPGGPDLAIQTVGRPTDSGTQAAFTRFVFQGRARQPDVVESGTDEVVSYVSHHPGAIGYGALGAAAAARGGVVQVAIDRVSPTVGDVRQGQYRFWAIERMYTRSDPGSLAPSYIAHVQRDVQTGDTFLRIADVPDPVLASHE